MRFTAAEQCAKLAKLIAIEGYDSIEELAPAISNSVSPAICMNETVTSPARWSRTRTPATARNAAPTRCVGPHPRRTHLTALMSLPSHRDRMFAGFL